MGRAFVVIYNFASLAAVDVDLSGVLSNGKRFQIRNVQDVFGTPAVDWSEIAYRHGYADQSHFNREFREFSGLTPSQYLARPGQGAKHAELVETG